MWMPTHVQLTVQRARGLLVKGKNGTNDCFVVISLGKEKYQTSVKEKSPPNVEWCEECELTIPSQGNTAEIRLQVLHRNFLGVDEFLGQTSIPLADFDVYELPRNRTYQLHSKPEKKDNKPRGELEVRLGFTVKAASSSTADLRAGEKLRSSLVSLPKVAGHLGGSLASLGHKKKSIKKLASSVGHKVAKAGGRRRGSSRAGSEAGSDVGSDLGWDDAASSNADPGVISEGEEDEFGFDDHHHGRKPATPDLHGSLGRQLHRGTPTVDETPLSSLSSSVQSGLSEAPPAAPHLAAISERPAETAQAAARADSPEPSARRLGVSARSSGRLGRDEPRERVAVADDTPDEPPEGDVKAKKKLEKMMSPLKKTPQIFRQLAAKKEKDPMDVFEREPASEEQSPGATVSLLPLSDGRESRVVEGGNERRPAAAEPSRLSPETLRAFDGRSRDSLIEQVRSLQDELKKVKDELKKSKAQASDLEEYLDTLLLRVMVSHPDLLQNPLRNAAGVKYAGRAC
ncbi:rab11 family-interacting protein 2-like [Amphibalanus amphitrite]|uniref:rab11 family-interacting protein 2-like n=1 Tax=Amphibalanus amphitrite TaxID=1232801 RepID=UPI001C9057F5|nr:rab11 family-interacting protein 2-like [Amphibalanus amphitrite]XP_043236814.1 rab11 family-interacting protein 2-like [Amphibalanus amphitrite]XP_043236815.1 rab11 family-interacting protein 2-like [Amphibalanus amphitrite]XP_043236816.1 rab11 family-interacting protein 2-like [Amphibalanus amphitrite]XP_043236817.1 rab11 family-interacting protein 2-like [Amphibalanus amphitrite]XP_043236818.1 rab11 family-interacting protein 2-like [Amphibalanus amphitrite]